MIPNLEKILREVETEEKIFKGTKRVQVVKAVDCIRMLSKKGYEAQEIKSELSGLLETYKLMKVKPNEKNQNYVDVLITKNVGASDLYMWTEEKYDFLSLFLSIAAIVFVFACVMFKVWPHWLQNGVMLLRYPVYVLLGIMLALSIIRVVVFSITQITHAPGLWIYPNLWAECGILESFSPMYAWNVPEEASKED